MTILSRAVGRSENPGVLIIIQGLLKEKGLILVVPKSRVCGSIGSLDPTVLLYGID